MISYNYKVVHFNNLKNTKFCIFSKLLAHRVFEADHLCCGPDNSIDPPRRRIYYTIFSWRATPRDDRACSLTSSCIAGEAALQLSGRLRRRGRGVNNLRSRTFRPMELGSAADRPFSPLQPGASAFLISLLCSPATKGANHFIHLPDFFFFFSLLLPMYILKLELSDAHYPRLH